MTRPEKIEMNNISDLVHALISGREQAPNTDLSYIIPERIGIYAWFTVQEDKIVYVGKATGKAGLYNRIMKQHLTEPRIIE
jgi:hypothetical protein